MTETTRLVGRITARRDTLPGLTADLRKAGYEIDICPDELIEDPEDRAVFSFLECYRNVPHREIEEAASAMLYELEAIAARHGPGMGCDDVRPVPVGHIAHNYATPGWRATMPTPEEIGV